MSLLVSLRKDLQKAANPKKAKFLQRFFRTREGEYGFGDVFIGVTVPNSRIIAKKYKDLLFKEVETLLKSTIHEERLVALFILVYQFQKSSDREKKQIVEFYLRNTKYVNNWDLVDSSADKIVGGYLYNHHYSSSEGRERSRREVNSSRQVPSASGSRQVETRTVNIDILYKLAKSKNMWERRIAMIATYQFIKNGSYKEAFYIAEILLHDKEDLIQKAVGWMLREVGKRCSREALESFLHRHYKTMPRTALRYAIEHFPEDKRRAYLHGEL